LKDIYRQLFSSEDVTPTSTGRLSLINKNKTEVSENKTISLFEKDSEINRTAVRENQRSKKSNTHSQNQLNNHEERTPALMPWDQTYQSLCDESAELKLS
jgi:hypothetical protein